MVFELKVYSRMQKHYEVYRHEPDPRDGHAPKI